MRHRLTGRKARVESLALLVGASPWVPKPLHSHLPHGRGPCCPGIPHPNVSYGAGRGRARPHPRAKLADALPPHRGSGRVRPPPSAARRGRPAGLCSDLAGGLDAAVSPSRRAQRSQSAHRAVAHAVRRRRLGVHARDRRHGCCRLRWTRAVLVARVRGAAQTATWSTRRTLTAWPVDRLDG